MAERCWVVGSLADCDLRVDNAAVSSRHCRLTQRGASFLLEDLDSTNGTFVDRERLTGPRIVQRGDAVTLGRSVPMPWPPRVDSVTIGRLPDNDIVIPLDIVSGHHARLDQEGEAVYLVDLGSSNGTSINDPLNKITRAAIQPTDHVFFGTHRVAAWELLRSLPRQIDRQSTAVEASESAELEHELATTRGDRVAGLSPWKQFGTRSSWMWGIGLSALCATVMIGAPMILGFGNRQKNAAATTSVTRVTASTDAPSVRTTLDTTATDERPIENTAPLQKQIAPRVTPAAPPENVVRRSEEALGLLGIRVGDVVVITTATVWACRPDAVICGTSILDSLESNLAKYKGMAKFKTLDACLVVCTPHKTLAILEHKPGQGSAEGFSLAKLEAPLDAVCTPVVSKLSLRPEQPLAMLTCRCEQKDKASSMTRKLQQLKVDRIERSADKSPALLHCSGDATADDVQGSPVFDAAGSVIGCVRPSAGGDVQVVPVAALAELLSPQP